MWNLKTCQNTESHFTVPLSQPTMQWSSREMTLAMRIWNNTRCLLELMLKTKSKLFLCFLSHILWDGNPAFFGVVVCLGAFPSPWLAVLFRVDQPLSCCGRARHGSRIRQGAHQALVLVGSGVTVIDRDRFLRERLFPDVERLLRRTPRSCNGQGGLWVSERYRSAGVVQARLLLACQGACFHRSSTGLSERIGKSSPANPPNFTVFYHIHIHPSLRPSEK